MRFWLVGLAVCSQSRKGCLGFTTLADRFNMNHPKFSFSGGASFNNGAAAHSPGKWQ
jgi:hypothetical protein